MVRLIWKLTAGIGISAAIIYKMDQNITQQQSEMKHRLEEAKSTLEKAVVADERAQQEKTREYYRNTQKYMSDRLVPSGRIV
ncbi:hypothetical protein BDF20DRAFT_861229 [Mycotypha africana]|uniref:uncharacterized protein n=1 Tax=Mycotypha africana TaxID=64632 RepID=UPI00230031D2|nr:uncharacterized protein BDF20DRAFT_861229 [Mycotypha africana]KAI8984690.1 hypothetical protein BDF20DRAFT_861229 [Mycotypha africana]